MRVQDIYKIMPDSELIALYSYVESKYLWSGQLENIPLEYMDSRIASMHTNVFNFTESHLIILID